MTGAQIAARAASRREVFPRASSGSRVADRVFRLAMYVAIGIGFLIGAASLSLRDSLLLSNIAEYVLPLAAGVVAPLSVLWHPIDLVARVIPLANLIEAGRTGVDEGMSEGFWGDYALALGTGVVWVIAAVVVWGRFERRARRVGTLESSAF